MYKNHLHIKDLSNIIYFCRLQLRYGYEEEENQ